MLGVGETVFLEEENVSFIQCQMVSLESIHTSEIQTEFVRFIYLETYGHTFIHTYECHICITTTKKEWP